MTTVSGRYVRVQSLYGPGTIGAWLLTTVSVLISWTLNRRSRRKDTLSLDLITTLLLPVVAAVHLFYLLVHLPVSIKEALTSQDENIVELVAAFEAPLNICETFSMLSLPLAMCCTWPEPPVRSKRLVLVLLTGLLSWAPENVLYITATLKGVRPAESILDRPYLFEFGKLVEFIWVCIAINITFLAFACIFAITSRTTGRKQIEHASDDEVALQEVRGRFGASASESEHRRIRTTLARSESSSWAVANLLLITCVLLDGGSSLGLFRLFEKARGSAHQPFFIPQSTASTSDLDQALALGTGGLVLLNSALGTWKSRKSPSAQTIAEPYAGRRRSI